MSPVHTVAEVFDAIQKAKTGAMDFRTNFFPAPAKLQFWVDQGTLFSEARDGATFFFRKDRDFWHLYFCAADPAALGRETAALPGLDTGRLVTDVVGTGTAMDDLLVALESAGFRRYAQLQRMMRPASSQNPSPAPGSPEVAPANAPDGAAILDLLERAFDRFGEQLPTRAEVDLAAANRQILTVKRDEAIAGLLFFETQGISSTVRFWVVAEPFRALRVGSALMLHYFQMHSAVKRFTLWVNTANTNAIQKYQHYHYQPDGLQDHILASRSIPS